MPGICNKLIQGGELDGSYRWIETVHVSNFPEYVPTKIKSRLHPRKKFICVFILAKMKVFKAPEAHCQIASLKSCDPSYSQHIALRSIVKALSLNPLFFEAFLYTLTSAHLSNLLQIFSSEICFWVFSLFWTFAMVFMRLCFPRANTKPLRTRSG